MKFKGTIIITDPGYLASGNKFLESTDHWWDETDLGENLHEIGITSYISEDTLYGDWSCFTYKGLKEEVQSLINDWNKYYFEFFKKYNLETDDKKKEEILSEYSNYSSEFVKNHTFGKFCADTGKVCVCLLEDVLKFNPNFKEWMETHPWCVTVIENFDGDIKYEVDENNEAHIVGMGNINFYTSQSGL